MLGLRITLRGRGISRPELVGAGLRVGMISQPSRTMEMLLPFRSDGKDRYLID